MSRASSTPKGAAAPAGSPANREIDALAARARDGRFLKQFEALVAFGHKPDPSDTVQDIILTHFLRDLAPVGALHVHGIIAGVALGEEAAVKSALTLAGGDGFRGPQVRLAPSPDSGWTSYMAKDFLKPFKHPHRFAATRGLAAAARDVFAGMVAFVSSHAGSNAESKSALTSCNAAANSVNFLTKALASPDLDRVAVHCGQQIGAEGCLERRLHLTGSRTCSRRWRFGSVPTLDTS